MEREKTTGIRTTMTKRMKIDEDEDEDEDNKDGGAEHERGTAQFFVILQYSLSTTHNYSPIHPVSIIQHPTPYVTSIAIGSTAMDSSRLDLNLVNRMRSSIKTNTPRRSRSSLCFLWSRVEPVHRLKAKPTRQTNLF